MNKFTNRSYGPPLQKINQMEKCLWYFHPSYGSVNGEITVESQKTYSNRYHLSVLLRKLEVSNPTKLIEIAV